jgi:hypothetical protein
MVLVCSGLQSGATTAELSELLQSRRYVLLERLSSERPGRELLQALREAPIDELEEHGAWLQAAGLCIQCHSHIYLPWNA